MRRGEELAARTRERTGRTALRSRVDIRSAVLSAEVMAEVSVKRREADSARYLMGTMRQFALLCAMPL